MPAADELVAELVSALGHGLTIVAEPISTIHVHWSSLDGTAAGYASGSSLIEALAHALASVRGAAEAA